MATSTYECTLTPESLEVAKRELNEDPETRLQKVQELRELFKTRADIKFRSDDEFLLRFLRNKKFNVDKAFKMMVHHYKARRDYPKIFNNFKPSSVKYVFDANQQMICPGKDREGRTVLLAKMGKLCFYIFYDSCMTFGSDHNKMSMPQAEFKLRGFIK
ncbi:alpha-tocopherol transfer protein-like [Saccoglossus kowalevskii]|uniref:Alpha-tocopherol transfer protein-like n=1 Tax=Saccoglossus kowalevskii TaxID=10224 RepID=A0ABM0MF59_SACKO|nr:PREDICTED: alpha-tocopherol transfer protein-like [Saccoglossus kowalevskii]